MLKRYWNEFAKGILKENPVLIIVVGLCPTLAVSTSISNAVGMGLSATFVLVGSSFFISSVRNLVPAQVRMPCYIVIIATFVTIVELLLKAYAPALSESLGIFIPLIVVNCIIMARAEAFASKQPVIASLLDAIGMGLGFTLALNVIAAIREFTGAGTLLNRTVIPAMEPALIMILAPGALLTLGLLIALRNRLVRGRH